jgi:hypothetical protein
MLFIGVGARVNTVRDEWSGEKMAKHKSVYSTCMRFFFIFGASKIPCCQTSASSVLDLPFLAIIFCIRISGVANHAGYNFFHTFFHFYPFFNRVRQLGGDDTQMQIQ